MNSPPVSSALFQQFPELSHLSREDLEDLLVDPEYFQGIFQTLEQVKSIYRAQDKLIMANESIAKNNLALEEQLYKLRSDTKEAFDEAKHLEARWKEVEREQREVYQRFTPQFLLMRLRHATIAQDELSERLASDFIKASSSSTDEGLLTNGKDVDLFVKEFRDLRKTYHKRVMWGDRWAKGDVAWRDD